MCVCVCVGMCVCVDVWGGGSGRRLEVLIQPHHLHSRPIDHTLIPQKP
jgi:hypothetical protein